MAKNFQLKIRKREKDFNFFSKYFNFFNSFLWTRRMELWKFRRKWVDKMLKNCWSKSDCDNQTFFLSKYFSFFKLVKRTGKMQFWQSYEFFFGRNPKIIYSRSDKRKKTISVFRKNIFLRHDPTETKGGILTTPPKFFRLKSWFFCSIYEHVSRIGNFSKNFFLPEVVSLDSRIQFWQPQRIFYRMLIFSKKLVFFQLVPTNT